MAWPRADAADFGFGLVFGAVTKHVFVSAFLRSRIPIETWEEFSSNLYGGIVVVLNCYRIALQVSMPSLSKIMYIQCSDSEISVSLRVRM